MINKNLILNKSIWGKLFNSWKANKLPHALLFHGPEGSGKEGHAIELAGLINCNSIDNINPCGNCYSCKKIEKFQHENIKLIIPLPRGKIKSNSDSTTKSFTEKSLNEYINQVSIKAKNPYYQIHIPGANTILINSIREIKRDISLNTINNQWKIILIFQSEKLCTPNQEAANSILKILEEPPKKTLFILVSSHPNSIISTILSRCQNIYFPPLAVDNIKKILENKIKDPNDGQIIANISSGNMRTALELTKTFPEAIRNLNCIINACFINNPKLWSESIELLAKLKTSNFQILNQLFYFTILFFRDLLYYSYSGDTTKIIFINNIKKIESINQKYPNINWNLCINNIEKTQNYINRNGYLPLHMTCLFTNFQKILKKEPCNSFDLNDWVQL